MWGWVNNKRGTGGRVGEQTEMWRRKKKQNETVSITMENIHRTSPLSWFCKRCTFELTWFFLFYYYYFYYTLHLCLCTTCCKYAAFSIECGWRMDSIWVALYLNTERVTHVHALISSPDPLFRCPRTKFKMSGTKRLGWTAHSSYNEHPVANVS